MPPPPTDDRTALDREARRLRNALGGLASLSAGRKRPGPAAATDAPAPLAPATPPEKSFAAVEPAAIAHYEVSPPDTDDWFSDAPAAPAPPPPHAAPADEHGFADTDIGGDLAALFASQGLPEADRQETLGGDDAARQDTPASGYPAPEPQTRKGEATDDILDGFEW